VRRVNAPFASVATLVAVLVATGCGAKHAAPEPTVSLTLARVVTEGHAVQLTDHTGQSVSIHVDSEIEVYALIDNVLLDTGRDEVLTFRTTDDNGPRLLDRTAKHIGAESLLYLGDRLPVREAVESPVGGKIVTAPVPSQSISDALRRRSR